MSDTHILAALSEAQTVGLTLYGEGRSEPIEGRIAIANVIRNRVRAQRLRWGLTMKAVCLKAWQFSCWLPQGGQDNYETVIAAAQLLLRGERGGPLLTECLWIADGLIASAFLDSVKGSTHYYNPAAMKPAGRVPDWAVGLTPVATKGSHLFFEGVK